MTTKPEEVPSATKQVNVSAQLVKDLRERTGAGFSDCRAALVEAGADIEKAIDVLRRKGQAAAQKKAQREATEGLIGHYLHAGGKIAVLVEINCESDFVARTEDFQRLCHDVAMHVAALDPRYVRREEVTPQILDHEREIYREQARSTGKPAPVIEKIVAGKMEKFYEENCLYEQHFIKDESVTVRELINQTIAKLERKYFRAPFCASQGRRKLARFPPAGGDATVVRLVRNSFRAAVPRLRNLC